MSLHPSLPFSGPLPYVVSFWAMFGAWEVAEVIINSRRSASSDDRDRGSLRILFALIGISLLFDFASALALPRAAMAAAVPIFIIGLSCVGLGTALRWSAVATLKRFFTVNVAVQASQPVITLGPYRYIRHPAYAGQLLTLTGFGLAVGNWVGLLVMLILPSCAFGYRIVVEEAALLSSLGEPYARYMRHTWRLVPGLV